MDGARLMPAFGKSWRQVLDREPAVAYLLDEHMRFTYCNPAWSRFAQDNGGVGLEPEHWLGRSILEAVPPILRNYYSIAYQKVGQGRAIWHHSYECSSPDRRRFFEMVVYPLEDARGVAVVNFVRVELPRRIKHPRQSRAHPAHRNEEGLVVMCANCRRTRASGRSVRWDWLPEFVEHPPVPISHGLCPLCLHYYSV
jgi:PAS domain-containing protein